MRIGLYFFSSLLLSGLMGGYVHSLHLGHYSKTVFGVVIDLPISVWLIIPALILLFFTLIHFVFYSSKNYFDIKKWQKDAETLENALYWSLLREPKEHKFFKKEIRTSASLLKKATIDISGSLEGASEKVLDALTMIKDINRGEYIDLKERGLSKKISKQNPIFIQNSINRLDIDKKFAEEVLLDSESYNQKIIDKALIIFSSHETFYKAKKFVKLYDVNSFLILVERAVAGENIGMNQDMLDFFIDNLKFGCPEYMKLARITVKKFAPDQNLAMFKAIQKNDEMASNAYLFLLFEYEMLDAIEDYLYEHPENEFVRYRALYTLKRNDSKYNMDSLVNSDAVCYDN